MKIMDAEYIENRYEQWYNSSLILTKNEFSLSMQGEARKEKINASKTPLVRNRNRKLCRM